MKNYYRLMLGPRSAHAAACLDGNFVGVDFDIAEDLSGSLPDAWKEFNQRFIPVWLSVHPDKSKVAAGLACGMLWTVAKGLRVGDVLLCPDGGGRYRLAEVKGEYAYVPGSILPHRREVNWLPQIIDRADMSEALRNSSGSVGTICDVSKYREEVERLLGVSPSAPVALSDAAVEDLTSFAMEKHLEDFLVANWAQTELGRDYDIYAVDGERVGQQYPTDTGPLDILAVSKDRSRLLVVELKRGRASDAVVGQILRYMGFVQELLAEEGQEVRGIIIALDDDQRIRRALAMVPTIDFYRYQVSFKLVRAGA